MSIKEIDTVVVPLKNADCTVGIYKDTYSPDMLRGIIKKIELDYSLKSLTLPDTVIYKDQAIRIVEIGSWVSRNDPFGADELIIPEGIMQIFPYAFANSKFLKVFWPSTCSNIPAACFKESFIQEVVFDIEKVKCIDKEAFLNTDMSSFDWPTSKCCDTIPEKCFSFSKIQNLRLGDNVKRIYANAFAHSDIQSGKIDCKNSDELFLIGETEDVDFITPSLSLGMDTEVIITKSWPKSK